MDTCNHTRIPVSEPERNTNEGTTTFCWKPFLRQVVVSFSLWMAYFVTGLMMGAPTVFIPQIRKEANDTSVISIEMASWITSVVGGAALLWVTPVPILMFYIGRKNTFALVCSVITAGYIIFYCSRTVIQILISEVMLGITFASAFSLWPTILTEYSTPRYRGVFLTIKSATLYWGLWVSNWIGSSYHWKNIGIVALFCCACTFTVIFWPESPYWLATKGRFDECARAHRILRGNDINSEKELEKMIESQKIRLRNIKNYDGRVPRALKIYRRVTSREYYMPCVICIILFLLYYSSAKIVCSLYAIDIFTKMLGNEALAYRTMLILDGVTVFSMYVGCGVSRYVNRRTMLFTTSGIGILLLYTMSLYMYLIKFDVIHENFYVTIALLIVYTLSFSVGPILLSSTIHGEIVPMENKSSILFFISVIFSSSYLGYVKSAPSLFISIGLHGAFLLYGVCSSICVFLLYKILPETKDKTLQEIEEYFRSNSQQLDEGSKLMSIKTCDIKHPITPTINADRMEDIKD